MLCDRILNFGGFLLCFVGAVVSTSSAFGATVSTSSAFASVVPSSPSPSSSEEEEEEEASSSLLVPSEDSVQS